MADQELGMRIKTQSDVPEQMGKARSATVSFAKQVEDIQRKFSTAFKDIFLGFTAPMVLLNSAISLITDAIAKAKQDAKEGLDLLAKGETIYATSEEKKMANFFKAKNAREDEIKLVQKGKEALAAKFLTETKEGEMMQQRIMSGAVASQRPIPSVSQMARMSEVQGEALKRFLDSPEGKAFKPIFEDKQGDKAAAFKTPEGFSNVVGVGSNPVIEAMNEQNDLLRQQLEELKKIASPEGGVPKDFTKDTK